MKKILILSFWLLTQILTAAEIPVSTYVGSDGIVAIQYELVAIDPKNTMPIFSFKITGEVEGKKPFALKRISGPGTSGVAFGAGLQTIYWNAAKDRPKDDPEHIKITIDAEDVSESANYLCLDLRKYVFHYQNDPPDISKSKCKTSELWFRRIEPGSFLMGSSYDEFGRSDNEDQHYVKINKSYYISVFETTQKQYKTICKQNPSKMKGATLPVVDVSYEMLRGKTKGAKWPSSSDVDKTYIASYRKKWHTEIDDGDVDRWYEEIPVKKLTFFGALRDKLGNAFLVDLPTEAQWEYACRAGTKTSLYNGTDLDVLEDDPKLGSLGWFRYNSFDKRKKDKFIHSVGTLENNAWGLYDMLGNVSEWCLDKYKINLGSQRERDPLGPVSGSDRVLRGGNYYDDASSCRSASRSSQNPNPPIYEKDRGGYVYDPERLNYGNGFRIVLSLPQSGGEVYDYNFEYTLPSYSNDTLPVFTTVFYGKAKDGKSYRLDDVGWLFGDGATGIAIGSGAHMISWEPFDEYTNLFDSVELIVDSKYVTQTAKYLVFDLASNKMRPEKFGPNLSFDTCRERELWLRRIEPGTFLMGSPEKELGRASNETQHKVNLTKAYYIGVFEITQAQYEAICGNNPSRFAGAFLPVESVNYTDIDLKSGSSSFISSLDKMTGNGINFALPTEAQWEYACRAGTTTALNNGTDLTDKTICGNLEKVANYYHKGYSNGPKKVGLYQPNSWGLYDMHGNVWEWCSDTLEAYSSDPVTDPVNSEGSRTIRGGGWGSGAYKCRSAFRCGKNNIINKEYRDSYIGFRIVIIP